MDEVVQPSLHSIARCRDRLSNAEGIEREQKTYIVRAPSHRSGATIMSAIKAASTVSLLAAITLGATTDETEAYPIDCAILLCLSGGWPASTECSSAKAEVIRRVTPTPIEPPLQIWRCPMGTGLSGLPSSGGVDFGAPAFDAIRSIRVSDIQRLVQYRHAGPERRADLPTLLVHPDRVLQRRRRLSLDSDRRFQPACVLSRRSPLRRR